MGSPSAFYTIPLKDLTTFLGAMLSKREEVIAPVATDVVRFLPLKHPQDVSLEQQAFFPLKEYFFRKNETIFSYTGRGVRTPEAEPRCRVFFGLRRCDLSAIARQDLVFQNGKHIDPFYAVQRQKSILIGYHCAAPLHPWCFCGSMDLEDAYDVMFWRRSRDYLIHARSEEGAAFLKRYRKLLRSTTHKLVERDRRTPGTDLLKKRNLAALYDHPDWRKGSDLCLSCSACTALCPTCFCYELREEPSLLKPGTGRRVRSWSSCQLKSFTRVAGGHVFREKRLERFKHRIFHQLQYFRDLHGVDLCTGCGRCIAACPVRIDFLSLINGMKPVSRQRIPLSVGRSPHRSRHAS